MEIKQVIIGFEGLNDLMVFEKYKFTMVTTWHTSFSHPLCCFSFHRQSTLDLWHESDHIQKCILSTGLKSNIGHSASHDQKNSEVFGLYIVGYSSAVYAW